ncbi:MAG: ComF family protein [candidate division WOR-3 bacterium]
MLKNFRSLFSHLLNFFYPPICPGCGKEFEEEENLLCLTCYQRLFTSSLAVCPRCGRPVPYFKRCGECRPKLNLSRIRALGLYQEPFKGILEEFKYYGKVRLGRILGDALSLLLSYDPVLKRSDFLVPIPLHPARRRERGYNQSEILARRVAERTKIPIAFCLQRRKNTKSQVDISPEKRFENIEGAFTLRAGYEIKGKEITLIDDVTTTGATLSAAAKVLRENGAKEVYGLVVAKG